jgi:hypothetical protein
MKKTNYSTERATNCRSKQYWIVHSFNLRTLVLTSLLISRKHTTFQNLYYAFPRITRRKVRKRFLRNLAHGFTIGQNPHFVNFGIFQTRIFVFKVWTRYLVCLVPHKETNKFIMSLLVRCFWNVLRSSRRWVSDFNKITTCPKIVVGVLKSHYHENHSDQSCAVSYAETYGETDMITLIVIFSNCFAKPPKNLCNPKS